MIEIRNALLLLAASGTLLSVPRPALFAGVSLFHIGLSIVGGSIALALALSSLRTNSPRKEPDDGPTN